MYVQCLEEGVGQLEKMLSTRQPTTVPSNVSADDTLQLFSQGESRLLCFLLLLCCCCLCVCVCVCVFGGCCCYLEENWLSGCHPDGHHMMFCTSWVTLRWLSKKHVSKWRVKHSMAAENGQSVGTKIHSDCSDRLLHQLQTASTDCSTDCCYRLFYKL